MTQVPSWSRSIWCDSTHIYLAIPSTTGEPYIAAYTLSENGLSKALEIIRMAYDAQPVKQEYIPPVHSLTKVNGYTPKQRLDALDVLRKAGLIPNG